jgi:hypothetical protein
MNSAAVDAGEPNTFATGRFRRLENDQRGASGAGAEVYVWDAPSASDLTGIAVDGNVDYDWPEQPRNDHTVFSPFSVEFVAPPVARHPIDQLALGRPIFIARIPPGGG